jgi:hypothetical protein
MNQKMRGKPETLGFICIQSQRKSNSHLRLWVPPHPEGLPKFGVHHGVMHGNEAPHTFMVRSQFPLQVAIHVPSVLQGPGRGQGRVVKGKGNTEPGPLVQPCGGQARPTWASRKPAGAWRPVGGAVRMC